MAINWTNTGLVLSNLTGNPEYRVEDDGLVRWRGTVTLTGASYPYIILPAAAQPVSSTFPFSADWGASERSLYLPAGTPLYVRYNGPFTAGVAVDLAGLVYQGTVPAIAAGGLITRDGQYEFNGLLLNDSISDYDTLRVEKVSGLFDLPDTKVTESELQDDHGGYVGREVFAMKRIIMDLIVKSSSAANMYNKLREIEDKFQPTSAALPLYFRRAGIGLMYIPVRPRKLGGFDTSYKMDRGFAKGSVMLVAPDPRKFSTVNNTNVLTIASGGTTIAQTVTTTGNFVGGTRPILEIDGPVTNPRIANAGDGGRTIRIDMVIAAGQKLIINTATRAVTLAGVDQSMNVRSDNQWWVLNRGANLLTFTRSNTPANTGVLTVKWNEAYA